MAMIGTLVFMGAMAMAVAAIWASVAPQWRRIADLASGHIERPVVDARTRAARRIAVRRWASAPIPAAIRHLRAA